MSWRHKSFRRERNGARKKVLLINPPHHAGVVEAAGKWPSLSFVYLAGALREAGFAVEIYDSMAKDHTLAQVARRIRRSRPDYVGTTAYTAALPCALAVLRLARAIDPQAITLLGGIHPKFCYREILEGHPDVVDYIVRGEGEVTLPELLACLEAGGDPSRVLGIAFYDRAGKEVVATGERGLVEDLDALVPAWDLLDWRDYKLFVVPGSRLGPLFTSRGCTNSCSFCSQHKFWGGVRRERRVERVVEDVRLLHDRYGVDNFFLTDEYPTYGRERWEEFLERLVQLNLGCYFYMETCAVDILRDRDILRKYRDAGFVHIYVGVEATEQGRLDLFKKEISCDQGREAIRLLNEAGIITECSFVLGLPDETPASIRQTLERAKIYNPDMAHFLAIAPWPYADLYEELRDHVVVHDYAGYNIVDPVVKPREMTLEELRREIVGCYKSYYMEKLPEYDRITDPFKRTYMLTALEAMMQNSFLRNYLGGLGEMPEEVRRYLGRLSEQETR